MENLSKQTTGFLWAGSLYKVSLNREGDFIVENRFTHKFFSIHADFDFMISKYAPKNLRKRLYKAFNIRNSRFLNT